MLLRPNAAGDLTQLTVFPSGTNWSRMQDVSQANGVKLHDGTNVLQTKTDLYQIDNIPIAGTLIPTVAAKADFAVTQMVAAGIARTRFAVKLSGVTYFSTQFRHNPGDSGVLSFAWTLSPATGLPWTRTEINRARIVANQLASVFQSFFRVPDPERFV